MSATVHYFDVDSEDLYMPCNAMAHFNKYVILPIASMSHSLALSSTVPNLEFDISHCRAPLVFKSLVRSGYWVPNMVTETLTG